MVFFSGKWRTNNTNYPHYSNANPRGNKEERKHSNNNNGERHPLLEDSITHNSANGQKGLSPVYETTNNHHASDEDAPPPPPRTNGHYRHRVNASSSPVETSYSNNSNHHQRHHSYIQSVLFGGLWTRNNLYEDPDCDEAADEEEDRPSLTSNFEVDSDLAILRLCGVYAVVYVLMAVVAFSFLFEQWTVIDSMYFAVATFTTVGVRTSFSEDRACAWQQGTPLETKSLQMLPSSSCSSSPRPHHNQISTETNNRLLSQVNCLPLSFLSTASSYWASLLVYLDMPLVWDSNEHCND